ncbi:MAG: T9SS type A sorting domain-containing protein [Bacteroidetes bacterium]|nr:T9SS type A sorting domain-containing protein [Bacteroidota bacterium]
MIKSFLTFLLAILSLFTFANPDTWVQKTSLPAQPRAAAVGFALNGYGYVGTGLDSSGILLDDFWKYDPSNDSWSQVASFAGTARKNAVAFVTDTFAYVGTGTDNSGLTNDFYRYDGQNNTWIQIENLDSAGSVYPRRDASAFNIGNIGYVVGGYDGTSFYSNETWEYDGNRDTVWQEKTAFPLSGRRWATAFSAGGFGFVGMGYNFSQEYFHDFWRYDAASNTWTQMADYEGNKRAYGVSFVINGFAFVGTGFDGALKDDFYKYDLANNQWSAVASFGGQPTSAAVGFSISGKGYVFGGTDTAGYKNELWEYTPDNTAGIESNPNDAVLQIITAPNPATAVIKFENLHLSLNGNYKMKLFDSSGKLVLEKSLTNNDKTVSVERLTRGIYYYSLSQQDKRKDIVTGKVILQ